MNRATALLLVLLPAILIGQSPTDVAAALQGAIDIHVHSLPDDRPRSIDAIDRFGAAIRQIGPEFVILSSDLGQMGNPLPAEGFGAFLVAMRARGFNEQEIDRMARQNPARLLGLR